MRAVDEERPELQTRLELVSLVEWTVGIEAGGALLGALSFGLGEAAAQGAEAGRIAATAARVSSIISRLVETAGAVGDAIESVATKIVEILSKLKTILRLGTKDAEVTGATADEEVSALKRLEQGCFLPGTMVLTEAGLRPIEQVTAGDLVVATDPQTGVQELRSVHATMTHTVFGVIDIEVAATRISCTSEHPILGARPGMDESGRSHRGRRPPGRRVPATPHRRGDQPTRHLYRA